MTVLASLVPGSDRRQRHHFLHDAPWHADALNRRRLHLWQGHPTLRPHSRGVLIVDETGDRKRGHGIPFAAQQYIGKMGFTANGVVSVTSHWTDGTRHGPHRRQAQLAGIASARGQEGSSLPHQGRRIMWQETLQKVQAWLCPWSRISRYWQSWSHAPPPPELAALLAHVPHSRPLDAPT